MVSRRCKMIVRAELSKLGLAYDKVDLGEAEIGQQMTPGQTEQLREGLSRSGLSLLEDEKDRLVEKIKTVIIDMVHYREEFPKIKNSDYISTKIGYNYTYLSNLFSAATGTTIEHFIIAHKIERAKELIRYNELNLTEIAWKLHYSSTAHLSSQFKKITGLTPTFFKNLKTPLRIVLEQI